MTDILTSQGHYECSVCGHEWSKDEQGESEAARVVKDANGNVLVTGDAVTLIKDLRLKGGSGTLKAGTKVKGIRIVEGDHEIDCKVDGVAMMLKACFVKKA